MTAHVQRRSHARLLSAIICVAWTLLGPTGPTSAAEALKSYNVDLSETSVSGISSGAFMAVQFGVAHSSIVKGVGATAGGPYFCASDDVPSLRGTTRQRDRALHAGRSRLSQAADQRRRRWVPWRRPRNPGHARAGSMRLLTSKRQRIWIFHGYNDGVVRYPVSDALYDYYTHFVDPSRIFYKDNLKAGHAQITDECGDRQGVCNLCQHTGGNFMNHLPASRCDQRSLRCRRQHVATHLRYFGAEEQPQRAQRRRSSPFRRASSRAMEPVRHLTDIVLRWLKTDTCMSPTRAARKSAAECT